MPVVLHAGKDLERNHGTPSTARDPLLLPTITTGRHASPSSMLPKIGLSEEIQVFRRH